jgi:HSP20 family protein
MAPRDRDILMWQRASDLLQQAERIHRNFLQIAVGAQYRSFSGKSSRWEPPVNVVETDESLWILSAIPGVTADRVEVRLDASELVITGARPMPQCCNEGELKVWEIPLGPFERRITLIKGTRSLSLQEVSLQDGLLMIELRKNP